MRDLSLPLARLALTGFFSVAGLQAQTRPTPPVAEKSVTLPMREIALYKNGVGFFQQAGRISGNALVQIDFTTVQLNDVLQSLTAADLGGGHIAGLGYDASETLREQLDQLHLGLGEDPTVVEFLQALKGTRVEVRGSGPLVTGKLLSVEVHAFSDPKTGEVKERRVLSLVTSGGGLRSIDLTPSVEVRMADGPQKQEIGRYLQLLATTHEPGVRHLTLEDRGTGERELQVSYITALPAWKSSYRILLTKGGGDANRAVTLQGFAVVDNTSAEDWQNVQLTLVSGAPQSFIQQISRPQNVARPEIPMEGGKIPPRRAAFDPAGNFGGSSVPINASALGGGIGTQVSPAKVQPTAAMGAPGTTSAGNYQQQAQNTLAPQTTSVDLDDLFEYKLSEPVTIRRNESAEIPILQTTLDAERVSLWLGREPGRGVQRALWLSNMSDLMLDEGTFSIMENGMFAGQGEVPLMHPKERRIVAYGADEAVKVDERETGEKSSIVRHISVADGLLTVHHLFLREHVFTIQNTRGVQRTVVLAVPQSDAAVRMKHRMSPWDLTEDMKPVETIGTGATGKLYRFEVQVEANSTKTFSMMEQHSHPTHDQLAEMSVEELKTVMRESHNEPQVTAILQPVIDAKLKIADIDSQLREEQEAINAANAEESRLRQNIATLKGSAEEKPLTKRYTDAMLAQEDKLAQLQSQREAAIEQKRAVQKSLSAQVHSLQTDVRFPGS